MLGGPQQSLILVAQEEVLSADLALARLSFVHVHVKLVLGLWSETCLEGLARGGQIPTLLVCSLVLLLLAKAIKRYVFDTGWEAMLLIAPFLADGFQLFDPLVIKVCCERFQ